MMCLLEKVKTGEIEQVINEFNDKYPITVDEIQSALFWAIRLGYFEIVKLLLEHQADANYQDFNGFSPLIWAAIYSPDASIIDLLLESGADVNHASTKRRQTPLHASAIGGHPEFIKTLLKYQADVNAIDYLNKTPLLHATIKGHDNCVKILLQYNCELDIPGVVQGETMTPLLCALINNNLGIVRMLILAGAHFQRSAIYQTFTIEKFYETVEKSNLAVRPMILQQQCRNRLRQVLKPDFIRKLQGLSGILSLPMQAYLSLLEFDT